jgi:hypothetical protein
MTDISRVRSVWSGFPGAPGVTTMYFTSTDTVVENLHAFWAAMSGDLPGDVNIQVESSGDILDSATGNLLDTWTSDPVASVACGGGGGYSAASGAVVDWLTTTVVNRKRIRGRTFIVPTNGDNYDVDGTLKGSYLTSLRGYAESFRSSESASFYIWHRGTGSDGSIGLVTASVVPPKVAVLRSRRD